MASVNIRPATRDDMPQVYNFIRDLAKYEKMEHAVKITLQTLISDGFESNPPAFTCLIAETVEHQTVGFALYYIAYSTWLGKSFFLEDLYVDEPFRRLGIGKKLFLAAAKIAYENNQCFNFHVLSWNSAVNFYKKLGAVNLTETQSQELFRLDNASLISLLS